uniref:Uncharacterized protein n=1 Tax=Oryza sativa subsp. japonica TaxID=39947 RepID=Q2QXZ4_ORYSJ|nr:hypothetical protein LOC_Os12g04390 [Oryza sativa Japonica Group]
MAACAIFSFARFFTPVTGCTLCLSIFFVGLKTSLTGHNIRCWSPLTDLHPSKMRTVISDHLSLTRAKSVRALIKGDK